MSISLNQRSPYYSRIIQVRKQGIPFEYRSFCAKCGGEVKIIYTSKIKGSIWIPGS